MPTEITTPNNAFRAPTAANDGLDFATGIDDLATDIDGMWRAGTLVLRPAASAVKANAVYKATDAGQWFISDGTSWNTMLVAGAWQALTLGAGVIAYPGAFTPSARLEGDTVRFKGTLQNNSGVAITAGTVLTVPASMANAQSSVNIDLLIISPGTSGMFLTAAAGSAVFTLTENGGTGWPSLGALKLDGLTYTIS